MTFARKQRKLAKKAAAERAKHSSQLPVRMPGDQRAIDDMMVFGTGVTLYGAATELAFNRDPGVELEACVSDDGKQLTVQPKDYVPEPPGPPLYVQSVDRERGVIVYGPERPGDAEGD